MKYQVSGVMTIGVFCIVEANSEAEARERAEEADIMTFCHQCAGPDPTDQWVTSGELDGEPQIETVEEA